MSLSIFGEPAAVANGIDSEVLLGNGVRLGKLLMTNSYLLWPRTFGLTVISISQITWVYKKTIKHSVEFIPLGSSFKLAIHTNTGMSAEIGMRQQDVDRAMGELSKRNPNARYGFSK